MTWPLYMELIQQEKTQYLAPLQQKLTSGLMEVFVPSKNVSSTCKRELKAQHLKIQSTKNIVTSLYYGNHLLLERKMVKYQLSHTPNQLGCMISTLKLETRLKAPRTLESSPRVPQNPFSQMEKDQDQDIPPRSLFITQLDLLFTHFIISLQLKQLSFLYLIKSLFLTN